MKLLLHEGGSLPMKILNNHRGFTLIEVVAALLLLSIILLSFFSFFIQSKKSISSSESINEATYIAQQEMEKVYALSQQSSLSNLSEGYLVGYTFLEKNKNHCASSSNIDPTAYGDIFTYQKEMDSFLSRITISTLCNYQNAGHVLIEIMDSNDRLKAKIENIYVWQ